MPGGAGIKTTAALDLIECVMRLGSESARRWRLSADRPLRFGNLSTTTLGIVTTGLCRSRWQSDSVHRRILDLYAPGDIFVPIEVDALPHGRLETVIDTEYFTFNGCDVRDHEQLGSDLTRLIIDKLAEQRQQRSLHLCALGGLEAQAKVAALAIELAVRLGDPTRGHTGFRIPLSRNDIADYLALNPDTLSRIVSKFRQLGVFQNSGRDKIYILDWEKLLSLCPISDAILGLQVAGKRSL